jgi:chromate transporter
MNVYAALALEFLKIGLFSVGGGLATLPFLYRLADAYDWYTRPMLVDMIAISESTPGPIGINMATYAGVSAAGAPGGVLASVALVAPSVVIAILITRVLDQFRENERVKAAFYGIRPAVTALIASSAFGIARMVLLHTDVFAASGFGLGVLNLKGIALFVALSLAMMKWKAHPVFFIAAGAAAGIAFGV